MLKKVSTYLGQFEFHEILARLPIGYRGHNMTVSQKKCKECQVYPHSVNLQTWNQQRFQVVLQAEEEQEEV